MGGRGQVELLYLVEEREGGGVDGDNVRRYNQALERGHVGSIPSLRSVLEEDTVGVHDVQHRFLFPRADVGDALLQVVLVEEAAVPYDAHVVLHRAGEFRSAMVLQDGDINPYVGLDQRFVYLCAFQVLTVRDGYALVILLVVGGHHDSPRCLGRLFDAARLVALLPIIAGMVEYRHLLGACGEAFPDQGGHQFRVGVAGQFRRAVPSDIRFNHYLLSFFHILPDASEGFQCLVEHCRGFATHDGHHIRYRLHGHSVVHQGRAQPFKVEGQSRTSQCACP